MDFIFQIHFNTIFSPTNVRENERKTDFRSLETIGSADETGGWGQPVKITGIRQPGRGPGQDYVAYICLSRQYNYLSTVQANPLDQAQIPLQLTISLSDLM
jgi:hypothetical protein